MREIWLKHTYPAEVGWDLGDDSYDHLIENEETAVYKPDGDLLCKLIPKAIDPAVYEPAAKHLSKIRAAATNRSTAATGAPSRPILRDGSRSKTTRVAATHPELKGVSSAIIGAFDRYGGRFPLCRQTAWVLDHPKEWKELVPYIREVSNVFKHHIPNRWEAQRERCQETHPAWVVEGSVFSTITVNRNWKIRTHVDAGDYKPGFGVMAVFDAGDYQGGALCYPKFRVAVRAHKGDVLLADVHEIHGVTPIKAKGPWERVSVVFYYREKLIECGSPDEEVERVRQRGFIDEL